MTRTKKVRLIAIVVAAFFGWILVGVVREAVTNTTGGEIAIYGSASEDGRDIVGYEDVGSEQYRREMWSLIVIPGILFVLAIAVVVKPSICGGDPVDPTSDERG